MKSKRSKACDISSKVKKIVWERDNERCIFCGTHYAMPNLHVVPRSQGGLGVEKNIVTGCIVCHNAMDQTIARQRYLKYAKEYLRNIYGEFDDSEVTYDKNRC